MGLRVCAPLTTTVLWYAGMKVSQVAIAEDSVTAAFALSFVNCSYRTMHSTPKRWPFYSFRSSY